VAGLEIAFRCAWVMLGTSMPFVVLLTSRTEDALGVGVPIPTCAKVSVRNKDDIPRMINPVTIAFMTAGFG
jgi:hypothetical protein